MSTAHTLRLISEFLTQGGHAQGIDPDTLDREAVLVAAAPDLLAALEKAQDYFDGYSTADTVRRAIAAAIAKATGEETNA